MSTLTLADVHVEQVRRVEIERSLSRCQHPSVSNETRRALLDHVATIAHAAMVEAEVNGTPFLADRWEPVYETAQYGFVADCRDALRRI